MGQIKVTIFDIQEGLITEEFFSGSITEEEFEAALEDLRKHWIKNSDDWDTD